MPALTVEEEIDLLVDAGLLTEIQATAYVYREVELVPRQAAADEMDIAKSTLDNYRGTAKDKIESARATIDALESIRNQLPDGDG